MNHRNKNDRAWTQSFIELKFNFSQLIISKIIGGIKNGI